jgi:hypothetical protein
MNDLFYAVNPLHFYLVVAAVGGLSAAAGVIYNRHYCRKVWDQRYALYVEHFRDELRKELQARILSGRADWLDDKENN